MQQGRDATHEITDHGSQGRAATWLIRGCCDDIRVSFRVFISIFISPASGSAYVTAEGDVKALQGTSEQKP